MRSGIGAWTPLELPATLAQALQQLGEKDGDKQAPNLSRASDASDTSSHVSLVKKEAEAGDLSFIQALYQQSTSDSALPTSSRSGLPTNRSYTPSFTQSLQSWGPLEKDDDSTRREAANLGTEALAATLGIDRPSNTSSRSSSFARSRASSPARASRAFSRSPSRSRWPQASFREVGVRETPQDARECDKLGPALPGALPDPKDLVQSVQQLTQAWRKVGKVTTPVFNSNGVERQCTTPVFNTNGPTLPLMPARSCRSTSGVSGCSTPSGSLQMPCPSANISGPGLPATTGLLTTPVSMPGSRMGSASVPAASAALGQGLVSGAPLARSLRLAGCRGPPRKSVRRAQSLGALPRASADVSPLLGTPLGSERRLRRAVSATPLHVPYVYQAGSLARSTQQPPLAQLPPEPAADFFKQLLLQLPMIPRARNTSSVTATPTPNSACGSVAAPAIATCIVNSPMEVRRVVRSASADARRSPVHLRARGLSAGPLHLPVNLASASSLLTHDPSSQTQGVALPSGKTFIVEVPYMGGDSLEMASRHEVVPISAASNGETPANVYKVIPAAESNCATSRQAHSSMWASEAAAAKPVPLTPRSRMLQRFEANARHRPMKRDLSSSGRSSPEIASL